MERYAIAAGALVLFACSSAGSGSPSAPGDGAPDGEPPSTEGGGGEIDSGTIDDAAASEAAAGDALPRSIDGGTLLTNLTPAQSAALCDWMEGTLGGYGTTTACSNGTSVMNAPDQATCVSTRLVYRCPVTVADVETCVLVEAATHGCDSPPACRPLFCQ